MGLNLMPVPVYTFIIHYCIIIQIGCETICFLFSVMLIIQLGWLIRLTVCPQEHNKPSKEIWTCYRIGTEQEIGGTVRFIDRVEEY